MSSSRTEGGRARRVVVVGAGIAGCMTALCLADAGIPVDLVSLAPAAHAPSAASRDGFRCADLTRGSLAAPLRGMVAAAPGLLELLLRMGVAFDRTPEGHLAQRDGVHFAGVSTGRQVLSALDNQLRAFEQAPVNDEHGARIAGEVLVRRFEQAELVDLVLDDHGVCVGCVAQDLRSMSMRSFRGDAVILATGGFGQVVFNSTTTHLATGAGIAIAYRAGAVVANAEIFQLCPGAVFDRPLGLTDLLRSFGGRFWTPRDPKDQRSKVPDKDRNYFLEDAAHAGSNTTDAIAAAIHRHCIDGGGIYDAAAEEHLQAVYLDISHQSKNPQLEPLRRTCQKLTGVDLYENPLRVFPAVSATLGGLWVDHEATAGEIADSPRNHATTISGLYAIGEAACQYDGAQRLDGNALPASLYGATVTARAVAAYRAAMSSSAFDLPASLFDQQAASSAADYEQLLTQAQDNDEAESVDALRTELQKRMRRDCFIERQHDVLADVLGHVEELDERLKSARARDTSAYMNQEGPAMRRLGHLLTLSKLVVQSAQHRLSIKDEATLIRAGEIVSEISYTCAGEPVTASARTEDA